MSELTESNITSNIISMVNNYRYFVTCGNEAFGGNEPFPFSTELYKKFSDLSLNVRFFLARELVDEICAYKDLFNGRSLNIDQRIVLDGLWQSFKHYEGIEREEFAQLLEVAPLYIVDRLIGNRSLPLDLLLNSSLLERHKSHPMFQNLQTEVQYVKAKRKPEIIAYARQLLPNSEHMTDEMVLSILGVTIRGH